MTCDKKLNANGVWDLSQAIKTWRIFCATAAFAVESYGLFSPESREWKHLRHYVNTFSVRIGEDMFKVFSLIGET
jgi:hypothetical protein